MPYSSDSDVPDYVPSGKRAQWRAIFNSTYERTEGDTKAKETAAFQAAGVVFKAEELGKLENFWDRNSGQGH